MDNIDQIVLDHYLEKGSKYCADYTGQSREHIRYRASRLGLKMSEEQKQKLAKAGALLAITNNTFRNYDKLNVDYKKFVFIDNPMAAYVLGFLWADGNININRNRGYTSMVTVTEDFNDIEPAFDYMGKWSKSIYQRKNRRQQTCIKTCNKMIYDYLKANDYHQKSFMGPSKILSTIPNEFKLFWFRGYSDGDGCFYFGKNRQFLFGAAHDYDWSEVIMLFNQLDCKYYLAQCKRLAGQKVHKHSRIVLQNKKSLLNWIQFLYPHSEYDGIGLRRKFHKAMDIRNYCLS